MEKKGQKLGLLTPVLILSFISWEFLGKSFLFSRCWFPYFLKKWSNQPALVCCQDQWDDIHKKWSCSVMSYSLKPHGHEPTRLLSPGNFPGKSTGVGCHFLLQEIFPTQGSNLGLPYCGRVPNQLSHQGSFQTSWAWNKDAVLSPVKYTKAQRLLEDALTCSVHQTGELNYVIGPANTRLHLWNLAARRFVCRGLTVLCYGSPNKLCLLTAHLWRTLAWTFPYHAPALLFTKYSLKIDILSFLEKIVES